MITQKRIEEIKKSGGTFKIKATGLKKGWLLVSILQFDHKRKSANGIGSVEVLSMDANAASYGRHTWWAYEQLEEYDGEEGGNIYRSITDMEVTDVGIQKKAKEKIKAQKNNAVCNITKCNPCVSGDSLIQTTMGEIPIKDLTQYAQVEVYTKDKFGELVIKPAHFFRTKTKAKVFRRKRKVKRRRTK